MEANLEVGFSIGEMETAVHGALNKSHADRPKPSFLRRSASGTGDGTNLVTLDLGSPPNGRIWEVVRYTLLGSDDHTVVASVLGCIYTGTPGSLSLANAILPSLAFPSGGTFSERTLWVHGNENLVVQTSAAGVAKQQYIANFVILEWRDVEIAMRSGR